MVISESSYPCNRCYKTYHEHNSPPAQMLVIVKLSRSPVGQAHRLTLLYESEGTLTVDFENI